MRFRRTSERTRANSATSLTGLVRKSSAPHSRPCTRSETSDSAVTMITGMSAVRASALRRRHTSKPSISGIITSRRTISGCSSRTARNASAPLDAVMTVKYSLDSLASSSLTLTSTSSTTSTRADMAASVQEPLDGLQEIRHRYRLGDIGLAAALADFFLIALHGKGGDGDDRDRLQSIILLDPFGDLEARDLGQLNIHEDEVRMMGARQLERLHAVLGLQRRVAVRLQEIVKKLHVEVVVLDDQNPLGGRPLGHRQILVFGNAGTAARGPSPRRRDGYGGSMRDRMMAVPSTTLPISWFTLRFRNFWLALAAKERLRGGHAYRR